MLFRLELILAKFGLFTLSADQMAINSAACAGSDAASVPEPSSLGLAAVAFTVLALLAMRRFRGKA
jgi:hypothetical protein